MTEQAHLLDLMEACWSHSSFFNCSHGSGTGSTCQGGAGAKHLPAAPLADARPMQRGACIDGGALPSLLDNWLQQLPPHAEYGHMQTSPILPLLSTHLHAAGAPPMSSNFSSHASGSMTTSAPIQEAALASAGPSRVASRDYCTERTQQPQSAATATAAQTVEDASTEAAPIKRGTLSKANGLLGSMIFGMSMSAMDMLPGAGDDMPDSKGYDAFEHDLAAAQSQARSQPCEERRRMNSLPLDELMALLRKHARGKPSLDTYRQPVPQQQQGGSTDVPTVPSPVCTQKHIEPAVAVPTSAAPDADNRVLASHAAPVAAAATLQVDLQGQPSSAMQRIMGQEELSFADMCPHKGSAYPHQRAHMGSASTVSQLPSAGLPTGQLPLAGPCGVPAKPVRVVGFMIKPETALASAARCSASKERDLSRALTA